MPSFLSKTSSVIVKFVEMFTVVPADTVAWSVPVVVSSMAKTSVAVLYAIGTAYALVILNFG